MLPVFQQPCYGDHDRPPRNRQSIAAIVLGQNYSLEIKIRCLRTAVPPQVLLQSSGRQTLLASKCARNMWFIRLFLLSLIQARPLADHSPSPHLSYACCHICSPHLGPRKNTLLILKTKSNPHPSSVMSFITSRPCFHSSHFSTFSESGARSSRSNYTIHLIPVKFITLHCRCSHSLNLLPAGITQ